MFKSNKGSIESISRFFKFTNEYEKFLDKTIVILEEYTKTGGENLLEVHDTFEKLTKLKIESEKMIYGIVSLRTNPLLLTLSLRNQDWTPKEKANFSYILYFLRKIKNKYDDKTLNDCVKFAQKAQETFSEKDLDFYIDIYKSIETLELKIKQAVFLNF